MKKPIYIRCPRCELNYCLKSDKYCNVCKKEMKASGEVNEELDLELCPVCHISLIRPDEDMCENFKSEIGDTLYEDDEEKEWRKYIGESEDSTEDDIDTEEEEIGENASIIDIDDEIDMDLDDEILDFKNDDDTADEEDEEDNDDDDEYNEDDEDDDNPRKKSKSTKKNKK